MMIKLSREMAVSASAYIGTIWELGDELCSPWKFPCPIPRE